MAYGMTVSISKNKVNGTITELSGRLPHLATLMGVRLNLLSQL